MKTHAVRIEQKAPRGAVVEVDGVNLADMARSVEIAIGPDCRPRVLLDLSPPSIPDLFLSDAEVHVTAQEAVARAVRHKAVAISVAILRSMEVGETSPASLEAVILGVLKGKRP